jgi:hypothetical protein
MMSVYFKGERVQSLDYDSQVNYENKLRKIERIIADVTRDDRGKEHILIKYQLDGLTKLITHKEILKNKN